MLYPYELPPAADLTDDQVAGFNCAYCDEPGAVVPIGSVRGVPLRADSACAEANRLPDSVTES
jgi:hypothetical protein